MALATLAGKLMAEAVQGTAERFDLFAGLPQPRFPGGAALRWPLLVLAMSWYALRDRLLMELWVALALGAPSCRTCARPAEGADARGSGVLGATYARFLFAAPLAVGLAVGAAVGRRRPRRG